MRKLIARFIKSILLSSGYLRYRFKELSFPGVAVLCYHGLRDDSWPCGTMVFEQLHVWASELESHCRLIRQLCNPISLDDWRAALNGGPVLPKRPVLFTFDDGYRTVFTLASPILKKYQIPAVIFISDTPMRKRCLYWFDAAVRKYGEEKIEEFKRLSFSSWQRLCEELFTPISDNDPHALLKEEEVIRLCEFGIFEIGAHTVEHGILSQMDAVEQRKQIVENKEYLEGLIKKRISAFAYPNGEPSRDYTTETVKIVREAGFDIAFTTRYGFADFNQPSLEYSRFLMLSGISAPELAYRFLRYSIRDKMKI